MLHYFKKNHAISVAWLEKARNLFPEDTNINEDLALVYSHLLSEPHSESQLRDGIAAMRRNLEINPSSANTSLNLAIVFARCHLLSCRSGLFSF